MWFALFFGKIKYTKKQEIHNYVGMIVLNNNPNHPKSCKILQGPLFGENSALLETDTFNSSNGAKLLPGKKYRP